jgi:hypothetical protein
MEEIIKSKSPKSNQRDTYKNINNDYGSTYKNTNIDNSNNITTQQINNIQLVAFGEENLAIIPDKITKQFLRKGFKSIQAAIEYIHFNKNNPNYHNVFISNMQNDYIMLFDGDKWKLDKKKEIIDQLYEDNVYYLAEKFEELLADLDECTIKKFKRFLNQSEEDETINIVKEEIKLILYNNKNVPIETRKHLCGDVYKKSNMEEIE